jgi:hypothetical protein
MNRRKIKCEIFSTTSFLPEKVGINTENACTQAKAGVGEQEEYV